MRYFIFCLRLLDYFHWDQNLYFRPDIMMSTLPTRILISFYAKREPNDGSLFYYIKEQKIQQIRLTRMGEPALILYIAFNEFRKLIAEAFPFQELGRLYQRPEIIQPLHQFTHLLRFSLR